VSYHRTSVWNSFQSRRYQIIYRSTTTKQSVIPKLRHHQLNKNMDN